MLRLNNRVGLTKGVNGKSGVVRALLLLAPGQLISWGTLYYAITFLAVPIELDSGWRQQDIFLSFSGGLLVAALSAAPVGRLLSQQGGRLVLSAGSLVGASALIMIALSPNLAAFHAGWGLAGLAMALTQYEAAFASLRALVSNVHFRQALGWLTLVGGFASTVFWPLTHWLAATLGWRQTLLFFAALHLVPCLVLHAALPAFGDEELCGNTDASCQDNKQTQIVPILLAVTFAAISFVTATISSQSVRIMEMMHVSQDFSLLILAFIGPMQIAGRLLDMGWRNKVSASTAGFIALTTLIVGLIFLEYAEYQPWTLIGFSLAYGMANGALTLVRGGAPAELMPQRDYAITLGIISAPALFVRALAPATAAWLITLLNAHIIVIMLIAVAMLAYVSFTAAIITARKHVTHIRQDGKHRNTE